MHWHTFIEDVANPTAIHPRPHCLDCCPHRGNALINLVSLLNGNFSNVGRFKGWVTYETVRNLVLTY